MVQTREFYSLPKISERTGFGSLKLKSGPVPEVGADDVLIKVHATSLNFRDLIITMWVKHSLTDAHRRRLC